MTDHRQVVRWHTILSLDGFIAGPDHSMDWVFKYADEIPEAFEVIQMSGAVLAGRNSYDVGQRISPSAEKTFGDDWEGQEFILTHDLPAHDAAESRIFLNEDVVTAMDRAREAASGKDILVIGANVARQCIEARLIDEILVHIIPVLIGDGVRLFGDPPAKPVELKCTEISGPGRVATLRYEVMR